MRAQTEEVRVGELEDLEDAATRLLELERGSFSEPWSIADFQLLAMDNWGLNMGLWYGRHLAGYALGRIDDDGLVFHLASLAIDPVYRRRGWGSRLLEQILVRAAIGGCVICRLEVRPSNEAAVALYSTFGFAQTLTKRNFYSSPPEDALIMERAIESSDEGRR
mgnify:CR=1 FL=1